MTDPSTDPGSRPEVWRAVDFATLSEPANCREYVALHQELEVAVGDRALDVACGAGLAEATGGPLRAAVTYGRPVEPGGPGAAAGSPQPV